MGRKHEDLTGQRFGRLTALEYAGGSRWRCQCDCGRTSLAKSAKLKSGKSRSCGCLLREENARKAAGGKSKAICLLRTQNPDMKAIEIARTLDISRERIRQILTKNNLPTKIEKSPRLIRLCRWCSTPLPYWNKSGLCSTCYGNNRFLSHRTILTCNGCGRHFFRQNGVTRAGAKRGYRYIFCNRHCFGHYAGIHFGLGTRTKDANIKNNGV